MNEIEFQRKWNLGECEINVSRETVGASGGERETGLSCHECQRLSPFFHSSPHRLEHEMAPMAQDEQWIDLVEQETDEFDC